MPFNRDILITGAVAIFIFIILIVFIILFLVVLQRNRRLSRNEKNQLQLTFQKEILKTQLETQEQTFHQIGEELHDNIGQLLSSTHMLLAITERSLQEIPDSLKTAGETLSKAIQDLRMLSKSLNTEWLHQFNVLDNLKAEIERINAARRVNVVLTSSVNTVPLNPESRVMLFRIIQEALNNAMKHSHGSNVFVNLSVDESIHIVIRDDGKGFDLNRNEPSGIGLLSMNHRTSLLGGTISWTSTAGHGTEVSILIPIENNM